MSGARSAIGEARIDEGVVRAMAALARLSLDEDEVARMVRDLGRIVAHAEGLAEVTLVDADEHARLERGMLLRPDVPLPSLAREVVLDEAPHAHEGGFAVPTFVDEG